MGSVEKFQAYAKAHDGEIFHLKPIGEALHSEAAAWQAAHNVAVHFWPDDSGQRHTFLAMCEVWPVVQIEVG